MILVATTISVTLKSQEANAEAVAVTTTLTYPGPETVTSKLVNVCSVCSIQRVLVASTVWEDFMGMH